MSFCFRNRSDKGNPDFMAKIDAKMGFHECINDRPMNSDVLRDLQETRQYWESYAQEFNRLVLEEMIALSSQA